ncbi:GNAT family N-acetyltransferase [Lyngbya aestuarii]|uniref:GNAT family N-acetyltransferase n=1 Tax=Lyngbya aestuarii TaxID=118322 RepID=UPI00403D92DD
MKPCFSFWKPHDSAPTAPDVFAVGASQLHIRTAQVGDLITLAEILADSFHSRTGFFGWAYPILKLGIYEDLRNRLRSSSPHYACLVAVVVVSTINGYREEVAGTVELTLRSKSSWQCRSIQYPYISNLAVRKSCRRQGVARKLLLSCDRTAREWNFQDIYLHVLENNHQARELYLKSGYRLYQVEPSLSFWLPWHSQRLFLKKFLGSLSSS